MLLLCAVLLVYGRVAGQDFVLWDDNFYTYENPHLNPLTYSNYAYLWRHTYEQMYIPVSYSLFALLMLLARLPQPDPDLTDVGALLDPHVFHEASLLLHGLNVLLVFALLRACVRQDLPAAAGALLFGLHPLQAESVAWVSELRGLLSGALTLGCLLMYLQFAKRQKAAANALETGKVASRDSRITWLYLGAALLALLALLAKPTTMSIPLMAFALDRWIIGRPFRAAAVSAAGLLILCIPIFFVTRSSQIIPVGVITPLWTRPLIAGDSLAFYLEKLFWPYPLCMDYGRIPADVVKHGWIYAAWIIPAAVSLVIWRASRKLPWLAAAGVVSLAVLLPVSGIVPFGYQQHSTVADRYTYLALIGPALALAFFLKDVDPRRAAFVLAPLFAILAVVTYIQVGTWNNTISLMRQAISVTPGSYAARLNLGKSLSAHGRTAEAVEQDRLAISIRPREPGAHNNLAIDLFKSGQRPEALNEFAKAIAIEPGWIDAHYNLSQALHIMGNDVQANQELQQCLVLDPTYVPAYMGLAIFDMRHGDRAGAEAELTKAIQMAPDFMPAQQMLSQIRQNPSPSQTR